MNNEHVCYMFMFESFLIYCTVEVSSILGTVHILIFRIQHGRCRSFNANPSDLRGNGSALMPYPRVPKKVVEGFSPKTLNSPKTPKLIFDERMKHENSAFRSLLNRNLNLTTQVKVKVPLCI